MKLKQRVKYVLKFCPICSKEFKLTPSLAKRKTYCSYKCYWVSLIGKPSPLDKRLKKICPICGRNFLTKLSINQNYCGMKCYGLSKKGKPTWNKGVHMWESREHPRGTLGKSSPFKGVTGRYSKETLEKMQRIGKELWKNSDYRKHMSEAHIGKMCGEKNPFYGKRHTIETRNKISKAMDALPPEKKRIRCEKLRKSQLSYLGKHPEKLKNLIEVGKKSRKPYLYADKGEWVRSKGEQKIANWLFANAIPYEYEAEQLKLEDTFVIPDFYLPKHKKYIEFYGMNPKSHGYGAKTEIKRKRYKKYKIPVIELFQKDLKDLDNNLRFLLS